MPLPRAAAAALLALSLALAGCSGNVSGDANPDKQSNQVPLPTGSASR
ncbi:MAG: hypothetical protein M3P46_05895 [Actinomycetota bacterium]|nr:hypothetical protein [Actinomycetota bacterium]